MTQSTTTALTTPLQLGDSGTAITILQQRLANAGYPITIDGDFGPATEKAVMQLQLQNFLVIDGIAGPKTQAVLLDQDTSRLLSHRDLKEAAIELDVAVAAVRAVNSVESRGNGFLDDGRPVILFERHIMRRRLIKNGHPAAKLQQQYPKLIDSQAGGYQSGSGEHYRLNMAISIDQTSALESCSWGLFQIMGYHWKALGYDSVNRFVALMHEHERHQLNAFVRFIKADPKLHAALRDGQWTTFAKRYNGPGYRKNHYHSKLAAAFDRYSQLQELAA
tara:strand:+ start:4080 stop:4910 length:831 start_codon:yes stop_codon:yes gene_type:complete